MDHTILNNFGHTPKDDCVLTRQFAGDLRAEVMTDSIIPDTVADVEKILLTTATPKIEGYYVTDSGFEVEGSVTYQTLLLTESGDLTTLTVTEPFTLKQEVALPSPDCQMILIPTLDYVTARLVNPRKLNLRSQTGVSARVFCCQSAKPDVSGTETLDDDLSLQRQIASVNTTAVLSTEDMNIPASHDVELDSNAPAAAEIRAADKHIRLHCRFSRVCIADLAPARNAYSVGKCGTSASANGTSLPSSRAAHGPGCSAAPDWRPRRRIHARSFTRRGAPDLRTHAIFSGRDQSQTGLVLDDPSSGASFFT